MGVHHGDAEGAAAFEQRGDARAQGVHVGDQPGPLEEVVLEVDEDEGGRPWLAAHAISAHARDPAASAAMRSASSRVPTTQLPGAATSAVRMNSMRCSKIALR